MFDLFSLKIIFNIFWYGVWDGIAENSAEELNAYNELSNHKFQFR